MAGRVLEQLGKKVLTGHVFLDNQAHPERVVVRRNDTQNAREKLAI